MSIDGEDTQQGDGSGFIRIGGASIVAAIAIHFILNAALKQFPPDGAMGTELQEYLAREGGTWAIVHGFRYVAFTGIILFASALFLRVLSSRQRAAVGWGIVGLLGTALWVTNGVVTNGLEILTFLGSDTVTDDLFWLLFESTRVLFTAEIATWGITILGFSVASWCSGALPRWLSVVGWTAAALDLLTGVLVVSVISGGSAAIFADLGSLASILWMLAAGIHLLLRGSRR